MAETCVTLPDGTKCPAPSDWTGCSPWDLTEQPQLECYVDDLQQQALDVAGAKINVYKLLGVMEQTSLVDLAKNGKAISGGDWAGFPAANAFTTFATEWRSLQIGSSAILASSYIGYDFGEIKIPTGRQRYGIDTSIRHHITTIRIKQSSNPAYRISKARVERSTNGLQWYGVASITLPNDDVLNTISFKHSVPNRYWRIRPLAFTGEGCDAWAVQALELHDYMVTAQNNIQDKIWLENRNRDYAAPIQLKGYYDLSGQEMDVTKWMADISGEVGTYRIKVNFTRTVQLLGRPIVIGDYFELPSEQQYTPTLEIRKKYLEVTDVTWDPETYTPGWSPTMLLVTAKPGIASEETQAIFGDLAAETDDSGLFNNDDGNNTKYQDYSTIEQTIDQEAKNNLPQRGSEGSSVFREFTEEELGNFVVKIESSSAPLNTFRVRGDYRTVFPIGASFNITGSIGNDGSYVVGAAGPTFTAGYTTIPVASVPTTNGAFGAIYIVGNLDQLGLGHIRKLSFNRTGLYVEDAMPQNDAPYTEGPTFPASPANGDYHRLTYTGLAKDVPSRLHRWSTVKGRWVYLETDRRKQFNDQKAVLEDYLRSPTRVPAGAIK